MNVNYPLITRISSFNDNLVGHELLYQRTLKDDQRYVVMGRYYDRYNAATIPMIDLREAVSTDALELPQSIESLIDHMLSLRQIVKSQLGRHVRMQARSFNLNGLGENLTVMDLGI